MSNRGKVVEFRRREPQVEEIETPIESLSFLVKEMKDGGLSIKNFIVLAVTDDDRIMFASQHKSSPYELLGYIELVKDDLLVQLGTLL